MIWYQKQPKKTKDFKELAKTYDNKYGNYDYAQDSRVKDRLFKKRLIKVVGNLKGKSVLVCGANSGHEIRTLQRKFPTAQFVAVDIARQALRKLPADISRMHASMDDLPFRDKTFDVYLNCRSIQSSGVDFRRALKEIKRVTKSRIVITIPNGYLIEGKIVNGMFDYNRKVIDKNIPIKIARRVKRGLNIEKEVHSLGEIFLIAKA